MNHKRRRHIQIALGFAALLIIGCTMLLNSPRVQQKVSILLATELENHIGTRVSLGGVKWLFPTDLVIDSLTIDDQEGEHLLSVGRIATKVDWMPLILKRQLSIRNIRLFNPNIHIYKEEASSNYNFQFLVDAFAAKEKKEKKPSKLSLRVNTLLIRHAHVCHRDKSCLPSEKLQFGNLSISDLSAQLSLKALSTDSVSLVVRQLGFKEQSGLCVDNLYLHLVANRHGATLANFQLDMPHSSLRLDTIWASYKLDEKTTPTDSITAHGNKKHPHLYLKGKIRPSHITPADLAAIVPQVGGITERINLTAEFMGSPSRFNLKTLSIYTEQRDLKFHTSAKLTQGVAIKDKGLRESLLSPFNSLDINLHEATLTESFWSLLAEQAPDIYNLMPSPLVRIGDITVTGSLIHNMNRTSANLQANTGVGSLNTHLELDKQGYYTANIDATEVNITRIIPESPLTQTNITIETKGSIGNNTHTFKELKDSITGTLYATATRTHILGYEYNEFGLKGNFAPKHYEVAIELNDPNGALTLNATYDTKREKAHCVATLQADSLNLHAMQLINIHENTTFSTSIKADLYGNNPDHMVGKIIIDSLAKYGPEGDYLLGEMALYASDPENKMLSLQADFMNATIRGDFTYNSFASSLLEHLHHSLPSLCAKHPTCSNPQDNLCLVNIGINDATPLRELLLQPIDLFGKAQVDILINDPANELKFYASAPHVVYNENTIKAISFDCHSLRQGLDLHAGATLYDDADNAITANIVTRAMNDKVDLGAMWNSNPIGKFEGTLHTQIDFSLDNQGSLITHIETDSTRATLNQSEWELDPFRLEITPEHIAINGLHFANDTTQHLSADGVIAHHETDTLKVSFNNLDLGYLLSLVKLEGISFDGSVSGHAEIANLYTEHPHVEANITAQDFLFCDGPLGNVDGHIHWNQDDTQLQFIADVWEDPQHITVVDGRADFTQDELWIDIAADSTNVSFLNYLLKSFMNDVKGHAYGNLTVGGPLKAINLDGTLLANVDFNLIATDVRYHFCDSLRFTPDVIRFNNIEAFDYRNQKAIVNGTVKHSALKDFAVDLYVDAQNVLGVDLPDTGNDSFYTTIYGTGGVHITASPTTPLVVDIQAQSEKGSIFALNLDSQSESQSEKFITFTNRSATRNTPTITTHTTNRRRKRAKSGSVAPTLIKINAQITPDAMLKLVMNQAVDDHISIYGSGDLQISSQGTDINLFGTYTANRGFYRLSLQDVINKSFDVLPGSTVSFDGDYTDARLNITARHVVNYVPFRDLSPEMTSNVHVHCLLHIGGTLNAPILTFGLELPQGTEEERAILQSYTNTEEQTNLQFIYLLGLGKFYTPDVTSNNQGISNMESFLSTTISGQINNLLSNIISNENWNFASNLRTENMLDGESGGGNLNGNNWENMEIEGILEGHLLDNRLLINGSFGYRDNPMYASNFIGDFDIRYRLTGGLSLKGYNKTNDRYFSRTSLTTQGLGLVYQRDIDRLFPRRKRKKSAPLPSNTSTAETPSIETTQ